MTAAQGGHIVTTTIEHKAVIEGARQFDVTQVEVDHYGIVNMVGLEDAINERTKLVSIGLANNEIGTIQPLRDIASLIARIRTARIEAGNDTPLWLHSDASQGGGQIDIRVARLGLDMLTLNSGKMYGPKQVGLLWRRPGVFLQPIVHGGGQEMALRSGTENVAGVIGFAVAVELAEKQRAHEAARLRRLRDELQRRLEANFEHMVVSGHPKKRLPGSLHVAFPGIDAERVLFLLEAEGVLVATGSACAASDNAESHVLRAIGMEPSLIHGSLRLTLGKLTDETSVAIAADKITQAVQTEMQRTSKR
jgi:cysteine desulfurase